MTLKSGLRVTEDRRKQYHSKAWVWFPIATMAVSSAVYKIFSVK